MPTRDLRRLVWWLLLLVAGCAVTGPHTDSPAQRALIPARAFFANTQGSWGHQVSPDGQRLAWLSVHGTGPALWVRRLPAAGEPPDVDHLVARGVLSFQWAGDSRHVLLGADRGGNENYHLLVLDTEVPGLGARDLTPQAGITAWLRQVLRNDPQQVLVMHNGRDRRLFDLYRIDILSGRQTLVLANPGDAQDLATDADGAVVGVVRREAGMHRLMAEFGGDLDRAVEVARWTDDDQVSVLSADRERRGFNLLSDRGRDRRALVFLDAANGQETVLHADAEADVEQVLLSPLTGRPLAATAQPGYPRSVALDAAWQRDLAPLLPADARRTEVLSLSRDEQRATLMVDADTERRFLLLDRRAGTATPIGQHRSSAYAGRLGVMRPVALTARDGLPLHGYLTLPPEGRTAPGPLVLLVHGGPWARDRWDHGMNEVQFLADRGYAVLQVNYRGSTGYGRRFLQAGIGEFAGRMHDDLIDAVQWAVAQGVADPQRVAIMGASYGGYATLVGLAFTPDTFACGVDIVGMSDLVSLVEHVPPYWQPFIGRWHRFVGNPADPAQREVMRAKSPIHRVADIRKPLLVIQTANDVRVRQEQSDMLVQALRAQGKPVDYLLVKGAGHLYGSWSWGNRLRAERRIEDFLAGCLGGRSAGTDLFEAAAWLF